MNKVNLNGKIIEENKAALSVNDRGFLYGDAIFESIRIYNGEPFLLKEHIKRIKQAGRITKIKIPSDLELRVTKLIKANNITDDCSIRITISRGADKNGYALKNNLKPTLLITSQKLNKKMLSTNKQKGIKVTTKTTPSLSLLGIKSTNLISMILNKKDATNKGFQDVICINEKGYITESLTGNIFLVKKNTLYTPPLDGGILTGVTRGFILKRALKKGLKVKETSIKASNLLTYDEIFITNSIQEVIPVISVNKILLPIGQVTIMLQNDYNKQIITSRRKK